MRRWPLWLREVVLMQAPSIFSFESLVVLSGIWGVSEVMQWFWQTL
jgi:hypothetical protein